MEKVYIVCVEDQVEVLQTVVEQLTFFENHVVIEECESASEALEVVEEIDSSGGFLAVVISDHLMPGQTGVDFLSEINNDERFKSTKKILLTGQATHTDTIQAINMAKLDRYIPKPWTEDFLVSNVKTLLTEYIFDVGIDYNPFMEVLDKQRLFELAQS